MAIRSWPENLVEGRSSVYKAIWVWTVPDHWGGPHCSTERVAEIPIESASSGSTRATAVTNTVSWRMRLARQATRSSRADRLFSQRSRSD
jgi:hypothetical protein